MPKGTSLENLAYKVIEGDKDAAKELMMSISEHIAYDDEGKLMSPKEIAENIVAAEEEPPPYVPKEVSPESLSNEEMEDFLLGLRSRSTGEGYPTEEAEKAMREDEEYKRNELIAGIKRNDDKLALEQYMLLQDAAFYGDLAKKMFAIGMTAEGVGLVLAPALKTQQVAAETIKDVFATATKKVTVPGTETIYKPYQKEEIIENLNQYIAKQNKLTKDSMKITDRGSPREKAFYGKAKRRMAERDYDDPYFSERIQQKTAGETFGMRRVPEELFGRDVDVPIKTTKDIEMNPLFNAGDELTVDIPVRGEITMESMKDVPKTIGKEAAALFIPFVGNYSSIQEADKATSQAEKQQQDLYENASPAVRAAIDKLK